MLALLLVAGCADSTPATSGETTATGGSAMAGPEVTLNISQSMLDAKPAAPDLSTPEAAVGAYLDWITYAYRTAQSAAAADVCSATWHIHVDSYIQYNIQKYRVIDQKLTAFSTKAPTVEGDTATVVAEESWEYSYRSVEAGNKVLEGPYTAKYEVTYSLVKGDTGWVVDGVDAKALNEVK